MLIIFPISEKLELGASTTPCIRYIVFATKLIFQFIIQGLEFPEWTI
jgi:hypothetical protein